MTLNKKHMVREVGRRTRLKKLDVERVIETLVEVWTEDLVSGGGSSWNTLWCWKRRGSSAPLTAYCLHTVFGG